MIPADVYDKSVVPFRNWMLMNGWTLTEISTFTTYLDRAVKLMTYLPMTEEEIKTVLLTVKSDRTYFKKKTLKEAFETFGLFLTVCCPPVNGVPDEA